MDLLILRDLHFLGRHGVLPAEAENAQPFAVTLELELPLAAASTTDDLDRTIDYCAAQAVVRGVLEGPRKQLIETLAENIAAALLQRFPSLHAVTVEVTKLQPPVDFAFAGVAVRLRRERAPAAS